MKQKHWIIILIIAVLSVGHLIFSFYSIRLYGYFNLQGQLTSFIWGTRLFRLLLDLGIILAGYTALREEKQRFLPIYLLFLLLNLMLPFLFGI